MAASPQARVRPGPSTALLPMRPILLPLALLAALVGCSKAPPAEPPLRAVRTMEVGAGRAVGQHEYAAEVRARTESRLGFRVGGKLLRRMVDNGDTVRAGQALAQLDAQDLKLAQEAAQAALAAAKSNLALSETEFKRYKELREQGFISGLELERRETTLKASRAQFEQAQAQAQVQGNQAGYAVLQADASGVVTAVEAEPGAVLGAGTPVLRLAHDGPRDLVFTVPENQVAGLRALLGKRDALRVRLWGQDALLPATVREVAAAADATTRTFQVKADAGAASLRLGQTATVLIETPPLDQVIKLPLSAVFELQGQATVWLLDRAAMTVQPRRVRVAGAELNSVVVSEGLTPGQTVVTAGVHALTAGQKVRLYQEPGAPQAAAAASAPASR